MTHTKGIAIVAMVASLILVTGAASAQTIGNATAGAQSQGAIDRGDYNETQSDTVNTDPGHIYAVNVTSKQSTRNWAGLYGNATGSLLLGDDNDATLYSWNAKAEYVYASNASSPDFTTLGSATDNDVQTAFGFTDSSDNATQTLSSGYSVAPATNSSFSTTGVTTNSAGGTSWTTAVIQDGANNLIFTGVVQNNGVAYNGATADYQAMVPTADGSLSGATQTYHLYMELQ